MAEIYAVTGDSLRGIADAIRSKTGSEDFLPYDAFEDSIYGISGGILSGTFIGEGANVTTIPIGTENFNHFLMFYSPFVGEEISPIRALKLVYRDFVNGESIHLYRSSGASGEAMQGATRDIRVIKNGSDVVFNYELMSTTGYMPIGRTYKWFAW